MAVAYALPSKPKAAAARLKAESGRLAPQSRKWPPRALRKGALNRAPPCAHRRPPHLGWWMRLLAALTLLVHGRAFECAF